jgi:integrase
MYQQMSERGLSARTIRYAYVVLKSAMQQAVRWRLLLENPADGVKVPQQTRNEMRALTVDQVRTLLKAAQGTKYGPVLAVALTTGMRPSEYLGLRWQDIDWARQMLSVVRSIRKRMGNGASQIPSVREAVVQSSCRAGLLLFFVICTRKRVRMICVQRFVT